jgi:iron complex outermembrane receptor protein
LEAHRCDVKLAIVRVTSLRVSFLAGAFCTAVSALGQEQPVPSPTLLPEVTVTATRVEEDSFGLPVSIDRVVRRAISEDKAQVNLSESLNGVPGVVVQNRQKRPSQCKGEVRRGRARACHAGAERARSA